MKKKNQCGLSKNHPCILQEHSGSACECMSGWITGGKHREDLHVWGRESKNDKGDGIQIQLIGLHSNNSVVMCLWCTRNVSARAHTQ